MEILKFIYIVDIFYNFSRTNFITEYIDSAAYYPDKFIIFYFSNFFRCFDNSDWIENYFRRLAAARMSFFFCLECSFTILFICAVFLLSIR